MTDITQKITLNMLFALTIVIFLTNIVLIVLSAIGDNTGATYAVLSSMLGWLTLTMKQFYAINQRNQILDTTTSTATATRELQASRDVQRGLHRDEGGVHI